MSFYTPRALAACLAYCIDKDPRNPVQILVKHQIMQENGLHQTAANDLMPVISPNRIVFSLIGPTNLLCLCFKVHVILYEGESQVLVFEISCAQAFGCAECRCCA